jgi:hypothetical protein
LVQLYFLLPVDTVTTLGVHTPCECIAQAATGRAQTRPSRERARGKETSLLCADSVVNEFGVVAEFLECRDGRQHLRFSLSQ